MAVTRSLDVNQSPIPCRHKPPVKSVEAPCGQAKDAGPCGLTKQGERDSSHSRCAKKGASTIHYGINKNSCGMLKMFKPRRTQTKEQAGQSISDIEISSYLNSSKEVLYKSILWEAMNKGYTQVKKLKRKATTKKDVSAKKAAKTTKKVESQKPSSRINYDALKILDEEWGQDLEASQIIRADSGTHGVDGSLNGNLSPVIHQSIDSGSGDWHQGSYCQDDENLDGHLGDEYYEDYECFDF